MRKLLLKMNKVMMSVMTRLMPTCEVVSKRVSRSLDEKLSTREMIGVKMHLLGCELCRHYRKQLLIIKDLMVKCGEKIESGALSDTTLRPEKKEKIKKMLREA